MRKGKKSYQLAGFIAVFTLAISGFEYLETGQLNWYKTPVNIARDFFQEQNPRSPVTTIGTTKVSELTGRVTSITDGDTLRIISASGENLIIRLYGIDAPERNQPYGALATSALREKIDNANINVDLQDIDDYGRYVGTIYLEQRNINLEMVAQGHAWWYEYFAPNNSELSQAQGEAQDRNLGLWNLPDPMDPYEWRRSH